MHNLELWLTGLLKLRVHYIGFGMVEYLRKETIQVVSLVCDARHGEEKANGGPVVDSALVEKFHKDTGVAVDLMGDWKNYNIQLEQ